MGIGNMHRYMEIEMMSMALCRFAVPLSKKLGFGKSEMCISVQLQKIEQVESLPFILTSSEVGMRDLTYNQ